MANNRYFSLLSRALSFYLIASWVCSAFANTMPVSGKVLDANSKAPITDVLVRTHDHSSSAKTDKHGQFTLELSNTQPSALAFEKAGYMFEEKALTPSETPVEITLRKRKKKQRNETLGSLSRGRQP